MQQKVMVYSLSEPEKCILKIHKQTFNFRGYTESVCCVSVFLNCKEVKKMFLLWNALVRISTDISEQLQ